MSEPEAGASPAGHGEHGRRIGQETEHGIEMMERVRAAGPNSAEAGYLREILKFDAYGALVELHLANRLFPRLRSLLRKTLTAPKTLPPPPANWQESADGLIYVSVEQSLDPFFDHAVFGDGPCRWRPEGGASVETYFVNKCLLTFKDLYLDEHEKSGSTEILCDDVAADEDRTIPSVLYRTAPEDPETRAIQADLIRRIGQEMTEQEARIIWDKSVGRTHKEIGRDLSISDDAVSGRLRRLRGRIGC